MIRFNFSSNSNYVGKLGLLLNTYLHNCHKAREEGRWVYGIRPLFNPKLSELSDIADKLYPVGLSSFLGCHSLPNAGMHRGVCTKQMFGHTHP